MNLRDAYRGMSLSELRCPLVLARAVADYGVDNVELPLNVHRYRQVDGNFNNSFRPGILRNNSKWEVPVCREAVVLLRPEFTGKPMRLTAKTKRKLCEVSPVSGLYHYKPGVGMCRVPLCNAGQ